MRRSFAIVFSSRRSLLNRSASRKGRYYWLLVLLVSTNDSLKDRPRARSVHARRQINLTFGSGSHLLRLLLDAAALTGRSPTRIAREVLEDYLALWLAARVREQRVIAEARERLAAVTER